MAKLYFHYSTMNAGKSTLLLQASHNYREGGMDTYLITAQFDRRAGEGRIASRIGIGELADTFGPDDDLTPSFKRGSPRAKWPACSSPRRSSSLNPKSGNWPARWMIWACL